MNKFKLFFSVLCFCSMYFNMLNAQSRLGLFIGGGTNWYYGDMNDRLLTHPKLFRYYFNGGLIYTINPYFDAELGFLAGKIAGADSLAIQSFNLKRNLSFVSQIREISARVNYHPLGYGGRNKPRRFSPYLFAGIGYFHHNPKAKLNGELVELQPLGTEGQFINGDGNPKPYKLYQISLPFGVGIETQLSRSFAIRLEVANHFTFFDHLDDLSSDYADSTKLAATPNGPLAVELASNLATGYPKEGFGRGDPKDNDSFTHLGISIIWRPVFHGKGSGGNKNSNGRSGGKRKKKANCPAYG
ncbi:hypothetical protein BH11BAC2_BH11BAC2_21990 [soil metagenome]